MITQNRAAASATSFITFIPAVGLLFAMTFLGEIPTWYQLAGLGFSIAGIYLLLQKPLSSTTALDPV